MVAVVGAGVGGLTLVAALARAGVHVDLYERGVRPSPLGDGLQLAPNAVRLLHRMGLTDALRAGGVHPRAVEARGWSDDRLRGGMPLGRACRELYGAPYYTLRRAHLSHSLTALVGRATIQTGRRLLRVVEQADGVRLEFADGAIRTADVVVGADGVDSVVRETLTGDERGMEVLPPLTGRAVYRGVVPSVRVPQLSRVPRVLTWDRAGQHCVCFPVDSGRTLSFAATAVLGPHALRGPDGAGGELRPAAAEPWSAEGALEELRAAYEGWNPAVGALFAAADRVGRWDLWDRPPPGRWSSDRLTLVGDAAQPALVFTAQSASQAVEDAVTLAGCLRDVPVERLPQALRRYEELRSPRRVEVLKAAQASAVPALTPAAPATPAARKRPTASTTAPWRRRERLQRGPVEADAIGESQTDVLRAAAWLFGFDADRATRAPRPGGEASG